VADFNINPVVSKVLSLANCDYRMGFSVMAEFQS
jgi:hypothetical protein